MRCQPGWNALSRNSRVKTDFQVLIGFNCTDSHCPFSGITAKRHRWIEGVQQGLLYDLCMARRGRLQLAIEENRSDRLGRMR